MDNPVDRKRLAVSVGVGIIRGTAGSKEALKIVVVETISTHFEIVSGAVRAYVKANIIITGGNPILPPFDAEGLLYNFEARIAWVNKTSCDTIGTDAESL
jgi:hypothetical protein